MKPNWPCQGAGSHGLEAKVGEADEAIVLPPPSSAGQATFMLGANSIWRLAQGLGIAESVLSGGSDSLVRIL